MSYIEIQPHDNWYETIIEDFVTNVSPHFGLSVSYKDVQFSGFWSQGDGASFTGNFCLSDVNPANLKATCPAEVELHQLVDELAELAESHPEIQGTVSRMSSRYSHSNTMIVGEYSSNNGYCNEETGAFEAADAEASLLNIFRQLADWLYKRLNEDYDFYLADATAQVWAEAIEELTSLQFELERLQTDVAVNPPKTVIQSAALTSQVAAMKVEIESLTSTIDQLSDQFHYWSDGKSIPIEEFYENHF